MDPPISPAEELQLQDTLRALLSPLEYVDVDAWRSAVNHQIRELFGADVVSFILPGTDSVGVYCEEIDLGVMNTYAAQIEPLDVQFNVWERQVALGAWDRETVHQPYADAYYRSAYYNEYILPLRAHDAIGITIALAPPVEAASVAGLLLHHDDPRKSPFGEHGLALLRLLLPAFRSGIHSFHRLHGWRDSLARTLDRLGLAMALFERASGRLLHLCPALRALLERDPDAELLALEIQASTDAAVRAATAGGLAGAVGLWRVERQVWTRKGMYRLRICEAGEALGREGTLVVLVEPAVPELPSDELLAERFGLTRAEARVARLLAEGKTNAEVAAALSISPHTAERHTERIFQKLDVHSRAAVGARLLRG